MYTVTSQSNSHKKVTTYSVVQLLDLPKLPCGNWLPKLPCGTQSTS